MFGENLKYLQTVQIFVFELKPKNGKTKIRFCLKLVLHKNKHILLNKYIYYSGQNLKLRKID